MPINARTHHETQPCKWCDTDDARNPCALLVLASWMSFREARCVWNNGKVHVSTWCQDSGLIVLSNIMLHCQMRRVQVVRSTLAAPSQNLEQATGFAIMLKRSCKYWLNILLLYICQILHRKPKPASTVWICVNSSTSKEEALRNVGVPETKQRNLGKSNEELNGTWGNNVQGTVVPTNFLPWRGIVQA